MRPVYNRTAARTAAALCGGLVLAMSLPANAAVDAKLLEMLRANGSINQAQYAELQTELAKDQQAAAAAQTAKSQTMSDFEKKIAWAAKTQIKGDIRLRQENVDVEGESADGGIDKNRQRIRARIGAYTEINPQVDAGIRIASGGGADSRSTNQDLDGRFEKKQLWLDLAYIDYHPDAIKNLHVIGGKMNQPWTSMGDMIWDSDINPEGLALAYKVPLAGKTELFGSAGYYTLEDNVDGDGVQFKNDLRMYAGQLGAKIAATDNLSLTVGGSVYGFDGDSDGQLVATTTSPVANRASGGNTPGGEFRLYEGFGQLDISGLPLPLSIYGQYVVNDEAVDDQDTAWLAGFKTKVWELKFDYNYRDVQRNAVVAGFADSDFALGKTGSRGHKFKVGYDIDKNFSIGAAYLMATSDYVTSTRRDADADILQLDAEVKF